MYLSYGLISLLQTCAVWYRVRFGFRAAAFAPLLCGLASLPVWAQQPPEPPSDITMVAGNDKVNISWKYSPSGTGTFREFQLCYLGSAFACGNYTGNVIIKDSTATTYQRSESGLNGTQFHVWMRTVNEVVHPPPITVPPTPIDNGYWRGAGTVTPSSSPPDFGMKSIADRELVRDTAMTDLVLPLISSGPSPSAYSLAPTTGSGLPAGLSFNAKTRTLSGTPTTSQAFTEYTYTATDADGRTATLAFDIAVVTPPPAPSKPSATGGDRHAILTWSSGGDGGTAITRWEYVKKEGSNAFETTWTPMPASNARTRLFPVAGLTNNTAYQFKVRAVNGAGNGAESPASDAVTPKPPSLAASSVTSRSALMTITNHFGAWWYQHTTPAGGVCTSAGTGAAATAAGLLGGTAYTFKAYSDDDCSTLLATAAAFTTLAATAPAAPAKPSLTRGDGRVTLSWTAPDHGGALITRYEYRKKTGANNFEANWTQIPNSASLRSHTVTNLVNGTSYQFKIRAVNSVGNGAESVATDAATPVGGSTVIALSSLSPASVPEGGASNYTVALGEAPTADVTVAIANRGGGGDDSSLSASPASLTFTSANWNTKRTVRISAAQDPDTVDGTAVFTHTATSTDTNFNLFARTLTATEDDDDTVGVTVSATAVTVHEGATATYELVLNTLPSHDVTITIAKASGGDGDIGVSPSSLIFTTEAWDLPRTVTLSASEDDDALNGTAVITHTAASTDPGYNGLTIASVSAAEFDDEVDFTLSASRVSVPEGSTANYTVVLDTAPTANVTITLGGESGGDADLTVDTDPNTSGDQSALSFSTANWNTARTVRVSAAEDDDDKNGTKVVTHTVTSTDARYNALPVAKVALVEVENDTRAITLSTASLAVAEGGTATYTVRLTEAPSANVTVAVANRSGTGDDTSVSANPATLTFTTGNWNTAQTVTLTAGEDGDSHSGTAVISHSASGGGYNGASAGLTATEVDNDAGFTFSVGSLRVPEGGTADYTVVLDTEPTADVTITLSSPPPYDNGDGDLTVDTSTLTFTTANWNTAQTVRVSAKEDQDDTNGARTILHQSNSSDSRFNSINLGGETVTFYEVENDAKVLELSSSSLSVTEGFAATYTLGLAVPPTATVTVAVAGQGDADLDASPKTLTFTTTNWNTAQTVTVTAAADGDTTAGSKVFTHTGSGGGYGSASATVTVTEVDANTLPTSADFSVAVRRDRRTAIALDQFPFSDLVDSLDRVRIVTLPGTAAGTLGTVLTGIAVAAEANCVGSIEPVTTGQEIVNSLRKVLYFCPRPGFSRASFEFKVIDSSGQESAVTYTATLVAPPGQVTGLAAAAGNTSVTLSWNDPNNAAIAGYEYRRKSGGAYGAWTAMTGADASTTGYTVSGLTNNTAYTFQVRASNMGGVGLASSEVSATPTAAAPAKPTGFRGTSGKENCRFSGTDYFCVHLFWDDPVDPSITRYEVQREHPVSPGNWANGSLGWSNSQVPGSKASTTSVKVAAGSQNNNPYKFRVRAVNSSGNSPWSDTLSVRVDSDQSVPILSPATAGNGRVRLDWRYLGPQSCPSDKGCWEVNGGNVSGSVAGTKTHTVLNLANGRTHSFYVKTYPVVDNGRPVLGQASNSVSIALPAAPAKPSGLKAALANAGASLSWTDPDDDALTGYQYRLKVAGAYGAWTRVPDSNGDTTSFIVPKQTGGGTHTIQIRGLIEYPAALGGNLAGAASDEVSAAPPGVIVRPSTLQVPEQGTATYTVELSRQPAVNVTVTATPAGDSSLTLDTDTGASGDQSALSFTPSNWNTARTITVSAAGDTDDLDGRAIIEHSVSSLDPDFAGASQIPEVTATEIDDDILLLLSSSSLSVPKGSTVSYTVALSRQPTANVKIAITKVGGTGLTVDTDSNTAGNQNTLPFTPANWSTVRTVHIAAAPNAAGTASFNHTLSGWKYSGTATLGATVVSLSAGAVTETTATLTLGGYTAAWWHQGDQSGAQCVAVPANTPTAALSGLTGGTSYTYKAYSAAGCAAANLIATAAAFTTLNLTATAVRATTATLTLSDHAAAWYYKHTSSTGGQCSSAVSGGVALVNLTGLAHNTWHTFKAYLDSGCATEIAAVDFVTLSGRVSGLRAAAGSASLDLSWDAQAGASRYKIQWRSTAEDWNTGSRQTTSTTASKTLTGLTNGTDYLVRVAAVFAAVDAAWSDEAAGKPTATPSALRVSNVTATGAKLSMRVDPGANNWYVKGTGGGGYTFACTRVSTAGGHALTNLSGNTSYVFQSFDRADCGSDASGTAYFTTPGTFSLAAHTVTKHSVVLELHGHDGSADWSYRVEMVGHESGRSCYAVRRGNAVSFGPLLADTSYTAQAFRGVTCQNVERMASVTFTTLASDAGLPALSVTNVGDTRASLSLANHAGEWFHDVDRDADTCTRVAAGTSVSQAMGLSPNTNYTVTAYSDPRCSAAAESVEWESAATFTTTGPAYISVSDKTATGFTVTLYNYTAANGFPANWSISAWRPRGDGGFEGSACQTLPRASTAAMVTGLKAGLTYTVSVYKGNSCSLASDAFSDTAATTSLTANAGSNSASLQLNHHEGDWSYRGGAVSGQTSAVFSGPGAGAPGQGAGVMTAAAQSVDQCRAMPAGTYSADIDGLSANTSYFYTAWAGPVCAGAELGRAAFTTPADEPAAVALEAAALSATSARLRIANHSGAWWYRLDGADGADSACAAAGGAEVQISGLTPGAPHSFTAYSAAECGADSVLASASALTPALMDGPLAGLSSDSGFPRPDLLSDLDGDGVTNVVETLLGTDPLSAASLDLSESVLDVLVLHTAQAAASHGGGGGLKRLIEERIDYANAAFAASAVRLRLRAALAALPGMEQSPTALLAAVAAGDSPVHVELRALRARLGADLVVFAGLKSEAEGVCGQAYLNGADGGFGAQARAGGWSWVGLDCSARWLAHGIGNNLGLTHSRGGGIFEFSVGHGAEGEFATIMADPAWWGVTGEQKLPVFSNPDLDCGGQPCGVDAETGGGGGADAARSLNITGPLAAAWFLPQWPWPNALPASPGAGLTGEVEARIALGASSGGVYRDQLRAGDTFDLVAEIEPDPRHVDLAADFHLLVRDRSGQIAQLGADGAAVAWDGTLEGLTPLRSVELLAAVERFYIVRGLSVDAALAGLEWEMFLAYRVGGELVYPTEPLRLRVTR